VTTPPIRHRRRRGVRWPSWPWRTPRRTPAPAVSAVPVLPSTDVGWRVLSDRLAGRVIGHAERALPLLDRLEDILEDNGSDPGTLQLLYQIDSLVSQMRMAGRTQRVFADLLQEELGGETSALPKVIQAAAAGIEHYTRLRFGPIDEDLAVLARACDDVVLLIAALLDNATRHAPAAYVTARLAGNGSVVVRIEDQGPGIEADSLAAVNRLLNGLVPPLDSLTGRHTGFATIVRVARKHGLAVQLMRRQHEPGDPSGMIALITIPPPLLCDVPALPASNIRPRGTSPEPAAGASNGTRHASGRPPAPGSPTVPPERDTRTPGGLPVRVPRPATGAPPRSAERPSAPETPVDGARAFAADIDAVTRGTRPGSAMGGIDQGRRRERDHGNA
jgi:hypothetical protein